MNIPDDVRADLEPIVGPIGENGLTLDQSLAYAKHMLKQSDEDFNKALGDTKDHYFAPKLHAHWFADPKTEPAKEFVSALLARAANALKLFLPRDQVGDFIRHLQSNRLPGFAGDKVPHLSFPAANCWFEVAFIPGQYPAIVPKFDDITMPALRVANLAIHCVVDGAIEPAVEGGPYKHAQIMAYVTDAVGETRIWCGDIMYGTEGARVFPCKTHEHIGVAWTGQNPKSVINMQPMSNVAQFVCGTLAHLIDYYQKEGGILPEPLPTETFYESTPSA